MGRKVRIRAEAVPFDYSERFGGFVPEGKRRGRTLADYKEEFGGSLEGEVRDPFGFIHRVSLAAFRDTAPHSFLKLQFVVAPEGEDFPPDYGDAVVLKEYELPDGTRLPGA